MSCDEDAESIRFTTAARTGVGTEFICVTKVGPIRLTDVMSITEWKPCEAMASTTRVSSKGKALSLRSLPEMRHTFLGRAVDLPHLARRTLGSGCNPILERLWRGNVVRLKRDRETALTTLRDR